MPKNYEMGGRTAAPAAAMTPAERRSWRERVGALRNLPPFLKLVWQTSRRLTLGQAILRIVRALLPVVTLYVGKLIIDEVVRLVQAPPRGRRPARSGSRSGLLDRIAVAARARVRRWPCSPTCSAARSRCSIRCSRSASATRPACG